MAATDDTTAGFHLAPQEYDPAIPLDQVSEHPANPNEGDDQALAEAMDELGFHGAILVQRSTGYIVAGNTRYRVARSRGARTLPGFWLDEDDGAIARRLAGDNRINRRGRDNTAKLLALLQPLGDSGLRGTGHTAADLAALVQAMNPSPPEEFPEYGDDIETSYECPACHYRWDGRPRPTVGRVESQDETVPEGAA